MSVSKILGVILIVVGLVLLTFAWTSSHAVADKVTEAFIGRFTQSTICYLITGLVAVIGGIALWVGGLPKS
jgi:hypothetical protein